MKKALSILLSLAIIISSFSPAFSADAEDAYSYLSSSRVSIHDPSILRAENGKYYCVGSHLAMAKSDNLINWKSLDSSIDAKNYLTLPDKSWKENLAEPLEWTNAYQKAIGRDESEYEYNCWANSIIYNPTMKKYCLYGCCSVWGTSSSDIWLAVSDNIEGPYEYSGMLVYSDICCAEKSRDTEYQGARCDAHDYSYTNMKALVDNGDIEYDCIMSRPAQYFADWNGYYRNELGAYPNAIDPSPYIDAIGEMWLVYGSFSGGCFVLKLDNNTGLPDYKYMKKISGFDVYFGKRISNTNSETEGTGEGPFIVYDKVSRYYYFFLTYGGLAANDGYNLRVYRSKRPDGPYEDASGNLATDMKNTGLKLMGNYKLDCQKTAYLSGGHSSCLIDKDGSMYQAYHTRFTADGGIGHQLRIHKMARTPDGWVVLLPFEYQGDSSKAVEKSDIAGVYEFIDSNNMTQKKETPESPFSDIILPKQYIKLNSNGTISNIKDYSCSLYKANTGSRAVSGSWSIGADGVDAQFKIGDVTYKGVFEYQKDESKSAKTVLTFSLAGNDNSTVWGVKHSHSNVISAKTPAKASANGSIKYKCSLCGEITAKTIYAPKSFTLSKTSYIYDSKVKTPSVVIKDSKGAVIDKSNYTVSYSSNKAVGSAKAKITFKNNYSGSKTLSFKINPKATSLSSLTAAKGAITVKWRKQAVQTSGYQLQYSTDSAFKSAKSLTVSSAKATSKMIEKLKSKKKYYIRIRTYKAVGKTKYYSAWSAKKSIKTK